MPLGTVSTGRTVDHNSKQKSQTKSGSGCNFVCLSVKQVLIGLLGGGGVIAVVRADTLFLVVLFHRGFE